MSLQDGLEVIHSIRTRETVAGGHLPVIALTARSRPEDREKCLAAGMDDFLTKLVQMPDLLAALDRVARWVHSLAVADSVLTPAAVLAACENDASLLAKLCGWFRERAPEHLAALSAARQAGDRAAMREPPTSSQGWSRYFPFRAANSPRALKSCLRSVKSQRQQHSSPNSNSLSTL